MKRASGNAAASARQARRMTLPFADEGRVLAPLQLVDRCAHLADSRRVEARGIDVVQRFGQPAVPQPPALVRRVPATRGPERARQIVGWTLTAEQVRYGRNRYRTLRKCCHQVREIRQPEALQQQLIEKRRPGSRQRDHEQWPVSEPRRRLEASSLVPGQAARQRPAGGGNHAAVTLKGTCADGSLCDGTQDLAQAIV